MKNLMIAQSGGPTAAINATMVGVLQRALTSGRIDKIYGSLHGIKGLLNDDVIEIGSLFANPQNMTLLCGTPSAALGSCRYKLGDDPAVLKKIADKLVEFNIGYFIYIGGNDSMDTVLKLSKYFAANNLDYIKIMGAPKTIDNDLCVTDHTPGFGTAAKYIAVTIAELLCDIRVYDTPNVMVCEIMGRNAGWLTCAASLAKLGGMGAPDLIYIPEVAFCEEQFIEDVKEKLEQNHFVLACVSEGIRDSDGKLVCERTGEKTTDAFGHKHLSGVGKYLGNLVREKIGCKTRDIEFSLMQRCSAHIASATDIEESRMLGAAALDRAFNGGSGEMSIIKRLSNHPYQFRIETTPIENVANKEKTVPLEWLSEKRNNVNQQMLDYLMPLIQGEVHVRYKEGIPEHIKLY